MKPAGKEGFHWIAPCGQVVILRTQPPQVSGLTLYCMVYL